MDNFLLIDFLIKLFYAVITLIVFWAVLRFRDKLIKTPFSHAMERIKEDGTASAIYYAGTAIAVAIVISSFF